MIFEYNNSEKKNGIYRITNLSNGRIYIGSAKPFKRRWNRHCNALNQGRHKNHYLQADFNKCGSDVFVFNVLEVVEGTKEERLAREQIYLDLYHDDCQQCYNMCKIAGSTEGYRHSPESKALIAAASKGHNTSAEHRAKISAANKGRLHTSKAKANMSAARKLMSAETKAKISAANKGRPSPNKGKKASDETKAKISKANKGKRGTMHSAETKAKMSLAARSRSAEHIAKIAAALKGKKASATAKANMSAAQKGRKCSDETRAKLSVAAKSQHRQPCSEETRAKISAGNKGKRRRPSVETKAKMSKSRKEYLQIFKALDNSSACIQENKSDFLVISAT